MSSLKAGGMNVGDLDPPQRPCLQLRWEERGTSKQSRRQRFRPTKQFYAGHKAIKQRKLAHCKGSKVDHAELAAQKQPQMQLHRLQVLPLLLLLLPVLPPLS